MKMSTRYQLKVRTSKYVTLNGKSVNHALVNGVLIPKNTKFAIFGDGNVIDNAEFEKRRLQGMGSYGHYFGKDRVYDSYVSAKNGKCIASMANNALNLIHSNNLEKAVNNSELIHRGKLLYLKAKNNDIQPNEEIFYSYGKTYQKRDYFV